MKGSSPPCFSPANASLCAPALRSSAHARASYSVLLIERREARLEIHRPHHHHQRPLFSLSHSLSPLCRPTSPPPFLHCIVWTALTKPVYPARVLDYYKKNGGEKSVARRTCPLSPFPLFVFAPLCRVIFSKPWRLRRRSGPSKTSRMRRTKSSTM